MVTQARNVAQRTFIQGRVAEILNERELAINVGSAAGVREGMKFSVLAAQPLEIRDPVTEEVLGNEDREKLRVQAVRVHERYTVCSTYRIRHVPATYALADAIAQLGGAGLKLGQSSMDIPETLRMPLDAPPPAISPAESYVRAGDRVIEVEDLPYEPPTD